MNCERVREHLSAYYDGELRDTIQQDIDSHLKQCPECRQVLSSYKRLSSLFDSIPSSTGGQPTAQDWDSLQAKLGATISSAAPNVSLPSRRISTSRILL
ncbi:zf-HC2 domain-containing protein, partial [bacterium]|nr:zf-HC2 domain-containing protein [bacterium]